MGMDDLTLVDAPHKMVMGSVDALGRPDAVIIDSLGYQVLFQAALPTGRDA
jgi:hypothetical protein